MDYISHGTVCTLLLLLYSPKLAPFGPPRVFDDVIVNAVAGGAGTDHEDGVVDGGLGAVGDHAALVACGMSWYVVVWTVGWWIRVRVLCLVVYV